MSVNFFLTVRSVPDLGLIKYTVIMNLDMHNQLLMRKLLTVVLK